MAMRASVVILNWNRRKETAQLLMQLQNQTIKDFEIIVVDNGSTDNSVPYLKHTFPNISIITNRINEGIAAKNQGIMQAKGHFIIIMDNDIIINQDCIKSFINKLEKNKDLGIACASVYHWKTKDYLGPNRSLRGDNRLGYTVSFFNGSAIAVRREVFKKTQGFSRDYYICLEELELAARVLECGFDIRCFTDIIVYNKKSNESGSYRMKQGYWYSRNWILFYIRFLPLQVIPAFALLHLKSVINKSRNVDIGQRGDFTFPQMFKGLVDGLLLLPKYILIRKPISSATLQRIKADLFPNKDSLYTTY